MPARVNDITNPSYELDAVGPIISYKRTGKTATVPTRGSAVFTGKVGTWYGYTNVTGDSTTSATGSDIDIRFPAVPAAPGALHWFSVWILHGAPSTTTTKFQMIISWRDINDVEIGGPAVTSRVAVPTTAFLRQAAGAVAPAGTDHAYGEIWLSSITDATVRSFRWDGAMFERSEAPSVPSYFDGDTAGAAWTGTAHASTSRLMTPGPADTQFLPFFTEG